MIDPHPTIVIATTNPGKQREVRAILAGLPVRWVSLADYGNLPEAVEDADSFDGNARIKALHYAGLTGEWALADDSGLVVDALDGAPGVHSARYAGAASDSAANNAKLIRELASVPSGDRSARFVCAVAIAAPDRVLATATGRFDGLIVDRPRGTGGFGYDPHFWIPDRGITVAELAPKEKNRISHRGRALAAIGPEILRMLPSRRSERTPGG